jgi:hypothetical protein|eukprot:COSAG02_NODE_25_length_52186_cov_56.115365_8_plen_56_part_00
MASDTTSNGANRFLGLSISKQTMMYLHVRRYSLVFAAYSLIDLTQIGKAILDDGR